MARAVLVSDIQKVYTDPASPLHCVGNAEAIANINAITSAAEAKGDLVVHVRHAHRADGSAAGRMFDFSGRPGVVDLSVGLQKGEQGLTGRCAMRLPSESEAKDAFCRTINPNGVDPGRVPRHVWCEIGAAFVSYGRRLCSRRRGPGEGS